MSSRAILSSSFVTDIHAETRRLNSIIKFYIQGRPAGISQA